MAQGTRRKRKLRTTEGSAAPEGEENSNSENNEEANEVLSATVIALSLCGSKLGFAVFDEAKEEITVDEIHGNDRPRLRF